MKGNFQDMITQHDIKVQVLRVEGHLVRLGIMLQGLHCNEKAIEAVNAAHIIREWAGEGARNLFGREGKENEKTRV